MVLDADGTETNRPDIERTVKMKISFHQLLLWAINDVRVALTKPGMDVGAALDGLMAILPPEIAPLVNEKHIVFAKQFELETYLALNDVSYCIEHDDGAGGSSMYRIEAKEYEETSKKPGFKVIGTRATPKFHSLDGPEVSNLKMTIYRAYVQRTLSAIITILDENGLLRDFRKEEIGGP